MFLVLIDVTVFLTGPPGKNEAANAATSPSEAVLGGERLYEKRFLSNLPAPRRGKRGAGGLGRRVCTYPQP